MAVENFINFGVAISYFVGIFFAFLKFTYITDILLGSVIITSILIILISLCSTLVVKYTKVEDEDFLEKDIYETLLEDYKIKINKKHANYESLSKNINDLDIRNMMEEDRKNNLKNINPSRS